MLAADVRRRLAPPIARPGSGLARRALADGLAWDDAVAGRGLEPRFFVRVAASPLAVSADWEFVGRVVGRHGPGRWQVDLGADYDHLFVIKDQWLFRVNYDLNAAGVIEDYLRCRAFLGHRISRRLGGDGRPTAG